MSGEIRQELAYELQIRIARFLHGTPLKQDQHPVLQINATQFSRLKLRKLRLRLESEGGSLSSRHLLNCLVPRPDTISDTILAHARAILPEWELPSGECPDGVWSRISELCDERIHNYEEFWEYDSVSKIYFISRILSRANAQGKVQVQKRIPATGSWTIGLIDSDDVPMLLSNGQDQKGARLAQLCLMCEVCSGYTHFLPSVSDLGGETLPECPSASELTEIRLQRPSVMCGKCERVVHTGCIKTCSFEGRAILDRLGREKFDWFCQSCLSEGTTIPEYQRFGFQRGTRMGKKEFEEHSENLAKSLGMENLADISAIEREYWSLLESERAKDIEVLYASDLSSRDVGQGPFPSQFGDYRSWDLRDLAMDKSSVLKHLPGASELQGVTRPWIYLGSHLSSFCWHTEDQHLFSISYLHKGAQKVWYTIPGSYREQFESALAQHLPDLNQGGTLHHEMVTMINPLTIQQDFGIPVTRIVQNEGEFVITFPGAYHAGFNTGINLAEAVNIALPEWLAHGLTAVSAYRQSGKESVFSMQELAWSASEAVVDGTEDRRQVVDFCVEVLAKAREKMHSVNSTGQRFVEKMGKCSRCMQVPFFYSCRQQGQELCVECVKAGESCVMLTRMTAADIDTRIDQLKRCIPQCQPLKRIKNS